MKKGGLDLSINSIVVIIFAITILGLGLAFIRGQFENIEKTITYPVPDIPAGPSKPIVLPFETINVNRATQVEFSVNYYNGNAAPVSASDEPKIDKCTGDNSDAFKLDGLGQDVGIGEQATFKMLLEVPPDVKDGKYACNLKVGEDTKQFFIEVE